MSTPVSLRLTDDELEALNFVCGSAVTGDLTPSEKIRQLIWREYNRRMGRPAPSPAAYQTAHRMGRPPKIQKISTISGSRESQQKQN